MSLTGGVDKLQTATSRGLAIVHGAHRGVRLGGSRGFVPRAVARGAALSNAQARDRDVIDDLFEFGEQLFFFGIGLGVELAADLPGEGFVIDDVTFQALFFEGIEVVREEIDDLHCLKV